MKLFGIESWIQPVLPVLT